MMPFHTNHEMRLPLVRKVLKPDARSPSARHTLPSRVPVDPARPGTWGPSFWIALHATAAGYPVHPTDEDKKAYRRFFSSIARVLPCASCRKHFSEIMSRQPLTDAELAAGAEGLSEWLLRIHNEVNLQLDKPERLTIADLRQRYAIPQGIEEVDAAGSTEGTEPRLSVRSRRRRPLATDGGYRSLGPSPQHEAPGLTSVPYVSRRNRGPIPSATQGTARKGCGCKNRR